MKVYIGWDSREIDAFNVCCHSLLAHAPAKPVVLPLKQSELREKGAYQRKSNEPASTEFTYTRFFVPYLCGYDGWAMFVDCDFLFMEDINKLFSLRDDRYAVMCVKHDYVPKQKIKMDGRAQVPYPRKNWSSLILWNNQHPANKKLEPQLLNSATGDYLHRFQWLKDKEIGELPVDWNWLVGEYGLAKKTPAALHYTNGGPWFKECAKVDYADLWLKEFADLRKK